MKVSARKVILWSLALLVIIVVSLGIVVYLMPGGCVLTKDHGVESDLRSLDSALAFYKLNAGNFPTTIQGLESLRAKPPIGPPPRRWSKIMDKVPFDPWGRPYIYRFPGKDDPAVPVIFSMGPDGRPDTADDVGKPVR